MTLEARLNQDLKSAMLAGRQNEVMTLRGLRSNMLNVKVANGSRDSEMSDDDVITILARESKKRQESADLYTQGDRPEKAEAELAEKAIIDAYLPAQLSLDELQGLVKETIAKVGATTPAQMGQVIAQARQQAGPSADGASIARLVKEALA